MATDELVDADHRRHVGVLAETADLDALGAAEAVNRLQIVGAHAVSDRAERRIGADAAVELRRAALVVDDLAAQFYRHVRDVAAAVGPTAIGGRQLADDADEPRLLVDDRNQVADRPILAGVARHHFAGDHALGAGQRDQPADAALRSILAAVLVGLETGVGR